MELKKLSNDLPRQSLMYLLLCAGGVLAFALVGILPSYRNLNELDNSIANLNAQIEEKKILLPIYQKLRESQAAGFKDEPVLAKTGLPESRIDNMLDMFEEIARTNGLEATSAVPELKSSAGDSKSLVVHVMIKGNFFNFRKLLVALADLPYLDHVEEVQIQEGSNGKEYSLKLWLIIDNPRSATN